MFSHSLPSWSQRPTSRKTLDHRSNLKISLSQPNPRTYGISSKKFASNRVSVSTISDSINVKRKKSPNHQHSTLNLESTATLDHDLNHPLSGCSLVIFLPYIILVDGNKNIIKPIKQPLVFNVMDSQFLEFGFDIPFNEFHDSLNNIFLLKISKYHLMGQIIATGGKLHIIHF